MKDVAILIAVPLFALTLFAEWLYFKIKNKASEKFDFSDTITNLNLGLGSHIVSMIYGVLFLIMYDYIQTNYSLFKPAGWLWLPVIIVAYDFVYYWAHRWGHEWNIFWGAHVVHHQSEKYNLSVALRQPWFHNLIAFPLFSMFPFIGFETKVFFTAGVFVTLYQYWIHTEAIRKMPRWFEYVFNTPSHHRVHHGVNPKYIDKNYGAVFILWDRIFKTFEPEAEQPVYGITAPYTSLNPFKANYYYFAEVFQLSKSISGWWKKFRLLFMAPGSFKHTSAVNQINIIPKNMQVQRKPLTMLAKFYILFQFALMVMG
ncbi:MAG TPA: sterol desaturase family protein, partial [Chitinophagales bacterium]|nr:sterol desaturase family protein [Chitinophagales bacterium]